MLLDVYVKALYVKPKAISLHPKSWDEGTFEYSSLNICSTLL